ncbi:MAG: prephenate dehydratase, partial [Clostridia bacterium]|nr:prephenate dehydratase [Clostridia bacterium]
MRIGYLGPEGTFSEEALHTWPGKKGAEEVPYPLLPELIESIASGTIDKAIVPLENSIEGTVYLCLDALMEFEELNIEGEIIIPIEHHLAARPETKTIEAIFSHPQALAQCRRFIKQQFPQAKLHPTASTAEAARLVSQKRGPFAAIAS